MQGTSVPRPISDEPFSYAPLWRVPTPSWVLRAGHCPDDARAKGSMFISMPQRRPRGGVSTFRQNGIVVVCAGIVPSHCAGLRRHQERRRPSWGEGVCQKAARRAGGAPPPLCCRQACILRTTGPSRNGSSYGLFLFFFSLVLEWAGLLTSRAESPEDLISRAPGRGRREATLVATPIG